MMSPPKDEHRLPDSEFIRIDLRSPYFQKPLQVDAYIRLGPNHYQKRFRKEDGFGPEDILPLLGRKGLDSLYIRRDDAELLLGGKDEQIEALIADEKADQQAVRAAAIESLEIVHEVAQQMGFTPAVQELAKKSVRLILKAIGNSPELSNILKKLKDHEGKYITSHSMMLAEISCAFATQLGWKSPATFMKLSISALLHDLSLKDNRLAQIRKVEDVTEANGFAHADAQELKLHPSRAADYSRELPQLPADVDVILAQHHERPDGKGFPRGLFAHQISPLASIFIVAHDLLDFYLNKRPANPSINVMEAFLFDKDAEYTSGTFKKIAEAISKGEPLPLA